MKKYIKMLPLIVYPYAYIIWFLLIYFGMNLLEGIVSSEIIIYIALGILIIYQIVTLINAIYGAVSIAKNDCTAYEAAKINIIVKAFHIPAYIMHFLLGILGFMLSVWGIGIIMFVIIVDFITIALTGINAIGCMIKLKKKNVLSTSNAVMAGIGSFLYCVDLIVAIIVLVKSKKAEDRQCNQTSIVCD